MGINPKRGTGPNARPLLKADIEAAQAMTTDGHAAARYLQVTYMTYRKYATLYGMLEHHKNPSGKGIARHKKRGLHGLDAILRGELPSYDHNKLKERLTRAGYLPEICKLCNFQEKRIIDGRLPLMLHCVDGNPHNLKLENLELRCYNCTFLTSGYVNMKHFLNPGVYEQDQIEAGELTPEDIAALQDELTEGFDDTHPDTE